MLAFGTLLGLPTTVETPRRTIVMRLDRDTVAFHAEDVHGLHRYDDGDVEPLPDTLARFDARLSRGLLRVGDMPALVLDATRLRDACVRGLHE